MDDGYLAVKTAAQRTSKVKLRSLSKLRLEVKFMRLQTELLKDALSPPPRMDSFLYYRLARLVDEMAKARNPNCWCDDLADHLDNMLAHLEAQAVAAPYSSEKVQRGAS
jgi:hypothetical protein